MASAAGFNNPPWDHRLMDLYENDPVALTRMTHADHARLAAWRAREFVMWLIARGALSSGVKRVHRSYYLPSMAAIATAIYENQAEPMTEEAAELARKRRGRSSTGSRRWTGPTRSTWSAA